MTPDDVTYPMLRRYALGDLELEKVVPLETLLSSSQELHAALERVQAQLAAGPPANSSTSSTASPPEPTMPSPVDPPNVCTSDPATWTRKPEPHAPGTCLYCDQDAYIRGLCRRHYSKAYRSGLLNTVAAPPQPSKRKQPRKARPARPKRKTTTAPPEAFPIDPDVSLDPDVPIDPSAGPVATLVEAPTPTPSPSLLGVPPAQDLGEPHRFEIDDLPAALQRLLEGMTLHGLSEDVAKDIDAPALVERALESIGYWREQARTARAGRDELRPTLRTVEELFDGAGLGPEHGSLVARAQTITSSHTVLQEVSAVFDGVEAFRGAPPARRVEELFKAWRVADRCLRSIKAAYRDAELMTDDGNGLVTHVIAGLQQLKEARAQWHHLHRIASAVGASLSDETLSEFVVAELERGRRAIEEASAHASQFQRVQATLERGGIPVNNNIETMAREAFRSLGHKQRIVELLRKTWAQEKGTTVEASETLSALQVIGSLQQMLDERQAEIDDLKAKVRIAKAEGLQAKLRQMLEIGPAMPILDEVSLLVAARTGTRELHEAIASEVDRVQPPVLGDSLQARVKRLVDDYQRLLDLVTPVGCRPTSHPDLWKDTKLGGCVVVDDPLLSESYTPWHVHLVGADGEPLDFDTVLAEGLAASAEPEPANTKPTGAIPPQVEADIRALAERRAAVERARGFTWTLIAQLCRDAPRRDVLGIAHQVLSVLAEPKADDSLTPSAKAS